MRLGMKLNYIIFLTLALLFTYEMAASELTLSLATHFIKASVKNDAEQLVNILLQDPTIINTLHQETGANALQFAIEWDNERIVKFLLAHGIDITWQTKKGRTALMMATHSDNPELVDLILTEVKKRMGNSKKIKHLKHQPTYFHLLPLDVIKLSQSYMTGFNWHTLLLAKDNDNMTVFDHAKYELERRKKEGRDIEKTLEIVLFLELVQNQLCKE